MVHAKFQKHRPAGSGKEDFLNVFSIYSHDDHLGHVTWIIYTPFCFPNLRMIGQAVSETKIFEYYDYIHVYNPGQGLTIPLGHFL